MAYDAAARSFRGVNAKTNFPRADEIFDINYNLTGIYTTSHCMKDVHGSVSQSSTVESESDETLDLTLGFTGEWAVNGGSCKVNGCSLNDSEESSVVIDLKLSMGEFNIDLNALPAPEL